MAQEQATITLTLTDMSDRITQAIASRPLEPIAAMVRDMHELRLQPMRRVWLG